MFVMLTLLVYHNKAMKDFYRHRINFFIRNGAIAVSPRRALTINRIFSYG